MDRITRRDLKSDKFAQEVSHTFAVLKTHPSELKRYGGIAAAVLVLACGIFFYMRYQQNTRRAALEHALLMDDGSVGPPPPSAPVGQINYPNQDAKDKALKDAFSSLASKYRGTQEGAIGELYLGAATADKGDLNDAEKVYKEAADTAPGPYASVAKMSLAQIYASLGRQADAEKILRDLIAKPTVFVSKEEATIVLAQLLLKSNPQEARKLLEPLRQSRTAVSQKAITTLGLIPQTQNN